MNSSTSQIAHLKKMLTLEEKRSTLEQQLTALDSELASLRRQLVSGTPAPAPKAAPAKAPAKAGRRRKSRRGELKNRIFAALEKAGETGLRVLDVARTLGTNPANVYAWFHAAETRYPFVKKIGPATYKLVGKLPAANAAKPAKAVKPAKKAKAAKAAKAPKARRAKGSKRGALQARILEALKAAGSTGETVKNLSAKLKMPYRNIQVWFSTTGKKNPAVKKTGPAAYQLVG